MLNPLKHVTKPGVITTKHEIRVAAKEVAAFTVIEQVEKQIHVK